MRWLVVAGWGLAAVFAVLWMAAGPCGGPLLRDPEADLLRDRIDELEADLASRGGEAAEGPTHPPLVRPAEETPEREPAAPTRFTVKVVSGSGLPDKDGIGKSDPFVVVGYDGEEHLTPVRQDTLDPVWGQSFEFRYVEGESLTLTVLDRDMVSHDLVGKATCAPDPEAQGEKVLDLTGGGRITVEIRFPQ